MRQCTNDLPEQSEAQVVNWQYFTGYTTYRVGLNIEVAQQPPPSRSVIEVRSPPFNFVIILHDRDVLDDEVVDHMLN